MRPTRPEPPPVAVGVPNQPQMPNIKPPPLRAAPPRTTAPLTLMQRMGRVLPPLMEWFHDTGRVEILDLVEHVLLLTKEERHEQEEV